LGAGVEISSLISLKNIINSETFEKNLNLFNLDTFKSDKINCQFFSKIKFKLSHPNQLEFIQKYFNFISGLINIDNKLEIKNEKGEENLFYEFDFSQINQLCNYDYNSQELKDFDGSLINKDKNSNLILNHVDKENELKIKSVTNAYFKTYEKYKYTFSPIGTNLNDIISNFTCDEDFNKNSNLKFLKDKLYFSDLSEYNIFKSFIHKFILGYQNFNVDELDHIHKQDLFKQLPFIHEANKQKIKSVRLICYRNVSELIFGLNGNLYNSSSKLKELTIKALEGLNKKFDFYESDNEQYKSLISENEISLNIPDMLKLEDLKIKNFLNFGLERGVFKIENGTLLIINDIEQLRFEAFEKNADINKMFSNLFSFIDSFEKYIKFCYDKKLGFITSNPEYIGTGLIIEIVLELKNILEDEDKFNQFFKDCIFKYEIIDIDQKLVKIKNHNTIGHSENDLLGNFILLINDIIEHDK